MELYYWERERERERENRARKSRWKEWADEKVHGITVFITLKWKQNFQNQTKERVTCFPVCDSCKNVPLSGESYGKGAILE